MKKFDVYFYSDAKGAKDREIINAETHEAAFKKYLVGKNINDFKLIYVDTASFFDSLTSSVQSLQSFNNPLYKSDEAEINQNNEKPLSGSDDNVSTSFCSTPSFSKADSGKLDKLIELQEKQLYWIRIIGIPFLFAAIGTFLTMLLFALNGGRRY